MSRRKHLLALSILACLFALVACGKPAPPPATTHSTSSSLRIVSLSPAISRTLVDLNLANHIVGRTPYCSSLDQSIPVVGDLQNINYEALVRLNPTHILVQPPAGGVDPHLQEVAKQHQWIIADWHLSSLHDVQTLVRKLPEKLFASDSDERTAARKQSLDVLARIDTAVKPGAPANGAKPFTGRILMVNAVNPVMAFGSDTYLDDVLHALGGVNAVSGHGWVQFSMEDVVRLAPDAIVLVRPAATKVELATELGPLAKIDVPAVKSHRLALLDHPDAFLPSSSIIGVAEQLRAILTQFAENGPASDNRP